MHLSATRPAMRFALTLLGAMLLFVACSTTSTPVEERSQQVPTVTTGAPTPSPAPATTDSPATGTPVPTLLPPTPTPFAVWLPPYQPLPPTMLPEPTPIPEPDDPLVATTTGNSRPTRVVVPALGIDLAVMKGNTDYPYCNVAQYLPPPDFVNPGQPGTTYMYGHARTGMFLPFLTRSKINDGASMIGMKVYVYTADKKVHLYKINIVKRHVRSYALARDLEPGEHRLIMQTSEGPNGSYPKLQVAARPIGVYLSTAAKALVEPHPKICG